MFVEHKSEDGKVHVSLSSPHNFAGRDEIVAKVVDVENLMMPNCSSNRA
jgi:hypothetical protein